jgi:hypothetical protein
MPDDVKFSGAKFAEGLDRIVSDPTFREALRKRPAEALPEIGIEIADKARARLVGERLAHAGERHDRIKKAAEFPNGPTVVSAVTSFSLTTVEVEVEIDADVVVIVLMDKEVAVEVEKVQKANVAKMRKELAGRR